MKKSEAQNTKQIGEYLKSQKESFREYQKNLSFSEKMEIAFSLTNRDKTIRRAVLLPKQKNEKSK